MEILINRSTPPTKNKRDFIYPTYASGRIDNTSFSSTTGSKGTLILTYTDGGERQTIELQNGSLSGTEVTYNQNVTLLQEKILNNIELHVEKSGQTLLSFSDDKDNVVIAMGSRFTTTLTGTVQDLNNNVGYFTMTEEPERYAGMGLDYFGARYYDPEVGVWVSTDPLKEYFSSYMYCGGNPLIVFDPNGKGGVGVNTSGSYTFFMFRGSLQGEFRFSWEKFYNPFSYSISFGTTKQVIDPTLGAAEQGVSWGLEVGVSAGFMFNNSKHTDDVMGLSKTKKAASISLLEYGASYEHTECVSQDWESGEFEKTGIWEKQVNFFGFGIGLSGHHENFNRTAEITDFDPWDQYWSDK